jgi:hypothetical protein
VWPKGRTNNNNLLPSFAPQKIQGAANYVQAHFLSVKHFSLPPARLTKIKNAGVSKDCDNLCAGLRNRNWRNVWHTREKNVRSTPYFRALTTHCL